MRVEIRGHIGNRWHGCGDAAKMLRVSISSRAQLRARRTQASRPNEEELAVVKFNVLNKVT
jgi:hypothetical protein